MSAEGHFMAELAGRTPVPQPSTTHTTLLNAAAALEAELTIEGMSEPERGAIRRGLAQLIRRSEAAFGDMHLSRLPALLTALGPSEPPDRSSALEWLAARFLDVFLRWLHLPDGDGTPLLGTI